MWISSEGVGGSASAKALRWCVLKASKGAIVQYASKRSETSQGPDCGPEVIEMTWTSALSVRESPWVVLSK